jgi:hypothetical protein
VSITTLTVWLLTGGRPRRRVFRPRCRCLNARYWPLPAASSPPSLPTPCRADGLIIPARRLGVHFLRGFAKRGRDCGRWPCLSRTKPIRRVLPPRRSAGPSHRGGAGPVGRPPGDEAAVRSSPARAMPQHEPNPVQSRHRPPPRRPPTAETGLHSPTAAGGSSPPCHSRWHKRPSATPPTPDSGQP